MIDRSLKKNLVHEDRWSRVYNPEPNFYASESKFEADGISVSIEELTSAWDSWNDSERLSFVNAYRVKTQFSKPDEQILEFLMAKGNELVWSTIAGTLSLHHSNKRVVLDFLLQRLRSSSEPKSNFIQALYLLGDLTALRDLQELYGRLSGEVNRSGGQPDVWIICDFLKCCEALAYLEKTERYRDDIQAFLEHPDETIRNQAQMALAGPQPEEFE